MTKKKNPKDLLKRGRKPVISKDKLSKLELAFSIDCTDEEACIFADISTASLYRYQNDNPEFCERKRLLKQKPVLKARINIKEGLESKDVRLKMETSKWLLERKRKSEFSTREELTGIDGTPLAPTLQIEFVNVNGSKE